MKNAALVLCYLQSDNRMGRSLFRSRKVSLGPWMLQDGRGTVTSAGFRATPHSRLVLSEKLTLIGTFQVSVSVPKTQHEKHPLLS